MSSECLKSISSVLPPNCPVKLKKIIDESKTANEILDNLLKVLGDVSNEPHIAYVILEIIPELCSDSAIQLSEIEFAILSFQNIFNMNLFKADVKCKLLEVIVTVMLSFQLSQEVTDDVVDFLMSILDNKNEPTSCFLSSLDCLIEIELNNPGILQQKIETFLAIVNQDCYLKNKATEITSLIIKNAVYPSINQTEILQVLIENLNLLCPFTMATVINNILDLCNGIEFQETLEKALEKLMCRYKATFDLCVLKTITSLQERLDGITTENAVFVSSTHPALPVGRNLIALDWLVSSSHLKDNFGEIDRFEPTCFDGADARLKKILMLIKISMHQSMDVAIFCHHFNELVAFAIKTATSRALAAVFRVMRNMIETKFPTDAVQKVVATTVDLGVRHPACLPHIVDFLKYLGANQSSEAITLGLVDSYDEMEIKFVLPHFEQLVQFFTESTLYSYEFCQPRMILHVVKNCLIENKKIRSSTCGITILELCQALIRNQDYEIFQPELKSVLSLVEASHEEADIKQRAWMLRSLITHVNTDSLKDAFDAEMNLSSTGKIVTTEYPLISLKVLFDYNLTETMPVIWFLERKRSCRSFYFPLEVCLTSNEKSSYDEYFGIQVDFIVDAKWGRAESLYIPVLEANQVKKACLQLQPNVCSTITIDARAVMSTNDGCIYVSNLEPIDIKLEHLLSPLSSNKSFTELWDQLTSQSEKCYTSALFLPQADALLKAVENGKLERFQMAEKKPTELAMVTPDSFLVLVRILSVKNSWHAEILVEDPSVLPVVQSLLTEYSTLQTSG